MDALHKKTLVVPTEDELLVIQPNDLYLMHDEYNEDDDDIIILN
ncbi:hypothetical protein [Photobacterium profundum]|uniref:Uncharacterized protein n=1 Tax=Photobacterium profundum 3TCK TaxID=314280 RepID=Q1Z0H5_9GAMM|nr:hypothetical protein [Photobacterium profundum]EAS41997.1 hypothetical protein P3TCK_11819 [Photobacterium profundum 3TCK]